MKEKGPFCTPARAMFGGFGPVQLASIAAAAALKGGVVKTGTAPSHAAAASQKSVVVKTGTAPSTINGKAAAIVSLELYLASTQGPGHGRAQLPL